MAKRNAASGIKPSQCQLLKMRWDWSSGLWFHPFVRINGIQSPNAAKTDNTEKTIKKATIILAATLPLVWISFTEKTKDKTNDIVAKAQADDQQVTATIAGSISGIGVNLHSPNSGLSQNHCQVIGIELAIANKARKTTVVIPTASTLLCFSTTTM
ncbi:MAG: hypothetical protein LBS76_01145 [Mycoplasmataceae bacterium]|nr:hypothetical protein [Mycoplasmataceae bacterium]